MLGIDRQARAAAALQRSGIRNSEKHDGFQVAKKHDLRVSPWRRADISYVALDINRTGIKTY